MSITPVPPQRDPSDGGRSFVAGLIVAVILVAPMFVIAYLETAVLAIGTMLGAYVLVRIVRALRTVDRVCIPGTRTCIHVVRRQKQ